ncbi:EthD family reductase [Pseudomonas putida]|uniref:EthD family reductase n=1 Tax=Pseudomonas putida TaxID=303 RepID=UPI0018D957D1|nr:EthD family reductase [Pseudomonas putida]MBH3470578.1 EthD family reductase [Pseudomonas putida]
MKRVVVVYELPENPAEFERHYRDVHIPLVKKMPNLVAIEASISGSTSAAQDWHTVAIMTFRTQAELDESLASPEGIAAVEDVSRFATGGCRIFACEFESF